MKYLISSFFFFDIEWKGEEDKNIYLFIEKLREESEKQKEKRVLRLFYYLYPFYASLGIEREEFKKTVRIMNCDFLNKFFDYISLTKIKNMSFHLLNKEVRIVRDGKIKEGLVDALKRKIRVDVLGC